MEPLGSKKPRKEREDKNKNGNATKTNAAWMCSRRRRQEPTLEQHHTDANERENKSGQARSKVEPKVATTQDENGYAGLDQECGVRFTLYHT